MRLKGQFARAIACARPMVRNLLDVPPCKGFLMVERFKWFLWSLDLKT